uniref:Uncharacterized protein n=1 Tax=Rhizophora mucronata TaxID=61149 RepID=A0A2P2NXN2_RHIMU
MPNVVTVNPCHMGRLLGQNADLEDYKDC